MNTKRLMKAKVDDASQEEASTKPVKLAETSIASALKNIDEN